MVIECELPPRLTEATLARDLHATARALGVDVHLRRDDAPTL
jgi:hypothetical protein